MLESTYYSNGKNNFKDNTFSAQEWSAAINGFTCRNKKTC